MGRAIAEHDFWFNPKVVVSATALPKAGSDVRWFFVEVLSQRVLKLWRATNSQARDRRPQTLVLRIAAYWARWRGGCTVVCLVAVQDVIAQLASMTGSCTCCRRHSCDVGDPSVQAVPLFAVPRTCPRVRVGADCARVVMRSLRPTDGARSVNLLFFIFSLARFVASFK